MTVAYVHDVTDLRIDVLEGATAGRDRLVIAAEGLAWIVSFEDAARLAAAIEGELARIACAATGAA